MIDAEDRLLNKVIDDSVNHEESLLFIKNSGMGINFKSELEAELAALGQKRPDGQRGYKAIFADNGDADVKNLNNDLPTQHTELSFKVMNDKMYNAAGILDYNQDSTNQNYNAIKTKYNKILNKIGPIREKLINSKKEALKILVSFMSKENMAIAKELNEVVDDVIIKYDNGFLINELDQQSALAQAVANKFLSRRTAAEVSTFAASDEYDRLEEEAEKAKELMLETEKNKMDDQKVGEREGGSTTGDLRQKEKLDTDKEKI